MSTNYSRCNSVVCSRYYTCKRAQMISNTEPTDYANYLSEVTGEWACGAFGEYKMYDPMGLSDANNVVPAPYSSLADYYRIPTHQCSICGEQEYPDARLITHEFWTCPDCLKKLRFLLSNVVIKDEN